VENFWQALSGELTLHLRKEEQVLFPMIRALEDARNSGTFEEAEFRGIEFPIERMIGEHEDAGEVLRDLRAITNGYSVPDDGCATFRALYQAMEAFERDMHLHIHLENNILFPRALEMAGAEESHAIR
jgi:regulator of cell morphogenesis and NO signaling